MFKQACTVAKLPIHCVSHMCLGKNEYGVNSTEHLFPSYRKRLLLEMKSLLFLPCIFMTE